MPNRTSGINATADAILMMALFDPAKNRGMTAQASLVTAVTLRRIIRSLDGYRICFFSGHAMSKNWIAVASAEHVRLGRSDGFMQVSHGKSAPLRRIEPGDRVVFYSP